jgi:hypothetical protein
MSQTKRPTVNLVLFITDDDGSPVENDKWHLVQNFGDAPRSLCGGHVFGLGESRAEFKSKTGTVKSVTCENCNEIVNWFKSL